MSWAKSLVRHYEIVRRQILVSRADRPVLILEVEPLERPRKCEVPRTRKPRNNGDTRPPSEHLLEPTRVTTIVVGGKHRAGVAVEQAVEQPHTQRTGNELVEDCECAELAREL